MNRVFSISIALIGLGFGLEASDLKFQDLYSSSVVGMKLTPKTLDAIGKTVSMKGYMAPPLRAVGTFFVLTKNPVTLCPFCNSDSDWPVDIVVVYLRSEQTFVQQNRAIVVTGRWEVGSYTDPQTGFVSQLRIVDATYEQVR